ncbi:hypothetical protein [Parashewanella tropica]|uniref:hypothetical protein n=1 Tax=Parashewanella tropica TaxID=2547970 RepID=UPI00147853CD|nr:hypothetical protein [Parashewanella tropica]
MSKDYRFDKDEWDENSDHGEAKHEKRKWKKEKDFRAKKKKSKFDEDDLSKNY